MPRPSASRRLLRATLPVLLGALLRPEAALAQAPPDLPGMSLEDLLQVPVVSAAHHVRTVRQAPATVYVVTRAQIRERGYLSLTDALRDAPGFDVTWMGGLYGPIFMARGLDAQENNKLVLMFDGVIDTNLSAGTAQLYLQYGLADVERIEVVYGPASALYGANAVGALVNVITRSGADTRGVRVEAVGMGWDPDLRRTGGDLGLSLGRRWGAVGEGVDLAASVHVVNTRGSDLRLHDTARSDRPDDPGGALYYFSPDHVGEAEDGTYLARARVHAERLGLTAGIQAWQHDGGQGTYGHEGFAFLDGLQNRLGTWNFRNVTAYATHRATVGGLANELQLVWRDTRLVDGIDLYFDVPGTGPDGAGTPPASGARYYRPDHSVLLDEHVQWEAGDGMSLTLGASLEVGRLSDYQLATGHSFVDQQLTELGPRPTVDEDRRYASRNVSAYVEHVWDIAPTLTLTTGGRLDAFHLDGEATPSFFGTADAGAGEPCPPDRPRCRTAEEAEAAGAVQVGNAWYVLQPYDKTRTTFNPRVGAVWTATAHLTVKALYGEGFRMPTVRELFSVTPSRVSGPDLDPEKVRTAEVRATFGLPGPGFVEAGVFRTAGTDFIALAPTAIPRPGRTSVFNQFTNVAAPRIWGVDLRAQAAVGHGLVLFGHYGFLDPRYAEAVPGIVAFGETDRIPRVATHQGLLGATWTSTSGRFHASPRLHLVGARPSVETSPLAEVPGVAWLDLSVGVRDVGLRGLCLSLVAANLTSTDILAPGFRTANKQNDFPAAHPEPGLHASAAVSYDWGF